MGGEGLVQFGGFWSTISSFVVVQTSILECIVWALKHIVGSS